MIRSQLYRGHHDAILSVAFAGDAEDARLVTASRDRTARTWSTETGKLLNEFQEGHAFLISKEKELSEPDTWDRLVENALLIRLKRP